jgi:glyoxylase-like metal-dependent hydrolase (beta-lactamase superfamily II)
VTAGLIVTGEGAILIDSMPFPVEAHEIATFAARVCQPGVRYVILTHYHADHTYGAFLFPQADVVAHALCRKLLIKRGLPALRAIQAEDPDLLEDVVLRLPDITICWRMSCCVCPTSRSIAGRWGFSWPARWCG